MSILPQNFGLPATARLISLRGFSGCPVLLVEDGGQTYVRKLARDADYNARLLQQAEKQTRFQADSFVQPVKVHRIGQLPNGLAYIDMDYVAGVTVAEIISTLPLAEIQKWAGLLLCFAEAPEHGLVQPSVFQTKIADLKNQLTQRNMLTDSVAGTIQLLAQRPWDSVPQSPCHGDLTLENILVSEEKLYLIDFLDSFADSWHMDMAKLMQDLIGGWSFRDKEPDRNLILRLASLRNHLESGLEAQHPGCIRSIHDLYALNLLRILPYSTSTADSAFIESRLSAALTRIL